MGWLLAIHQLAIGWLSAGYQMAISWVWGDYGLAMDWLWLAMDWLLAGYGLSISKVWTGYRLGMEWLWTGYGLAVGYHSAGHQLAIGWISAGHWLAFGWPWPKINTLQDTVIYYYVPKWHMAVINPLDCSVFTSYFGYRLVIGWLLAGYWLAMALNQYPSTHSHIPLRTKAAHGCNQYFGLY